MNNQGCICMLRVEMHLHIFANCEKRIINTTDIGQKLYQYAEMNFSVIFVRAQMTISMT